MIRVRRLSALGAGGLCLAVVLWLSADSLVVAQSGKSKTKVKSATSAEVKKLDAKLEEVQGSFLKETGSIIKGYKDAGQFDRAKMLLEVLLKLDPKNEAIKKEIEQLDDQILDTTGFEIDLDPSKSWEKVGLVAKDRLIRIEVEGEYKFNASMVLGPDGVPTRDPANDLVGGVPLGAVVAVIIPADGGEQRNNGNNANGKTPSPFSVGAKHEQTPKQDGALLIRVNVPPGSKCTGKLKVKVGGVAKG